MRIDHLIARSILDTRGRPTIETTLTAGEFSATASVPSGKSTGEHEASERRDADGGVTEEIANENNEVASVLTGRDFESLDSLDTFLIKLDGTPNKSRLGANTILSISIAAQRLSALIDSVPLWKAIAKRAGTTPRAPRLFVNVMNGGVHARFRLPFQEYMLIVDGNTSVALPIVQQAFEKLGHQLGADVPMGDEGGYSPRFATIEEPFQILAELIKDSSGMSIAIDAAASEFFKDDAYTLLGKAYSAKELTTIYGSIVTKYPIRSIEDPFDENSHDDFANLTKTLGEKILIVGDDLTVTNPARITDAIAGKEINAVLIKPNQIGTVHEAILAVQKTYAAGLKAIASHRSGETDDTFIADFAYGIGAYGIKGGGLGQKERVEKYNRLLAIEHEARMV